MVWHWTSACLRDAPDDFLVVSGPCVELAHRLSAAIGNMRLASACISLYERITPDRISLACIRLVSTWIGPSLSHLWSDIVGMRLYQHTLHARVSVGLGVVVCLVCMQIVFCIQPCFSKRVRNEHIVRV